MNRILEIDLENERAVVQPGVVNLEITNAVQDSGYFYAPDPSSQRACTIGGNVAENAGGPHTLAYGVTTNHVLGLEFVMPDGTVCETAARRPICPGTISPASSPVPREPWCWSLRITIRLMRKPELVKTILAIYDRSEDAGRTVAEITARAITPVAVEMLDGVMLRMVEEATQAGYPMDAAAVLLIELEGIRESVEAQVEEIRAACNGCGAREVRVARSAEERDLLWKGRKNAFGAVGRVSPTYYVQDGVVPRTKVEPTLRFIGEVSERYGLKISNIFHAGDGNLHPHHPVQRTGPRRVGESEGGGRRDPAILRGCRRVHHGRARSRHGEERADGSPVPGGDSGKDAGAEGAVRSGLPVEIRGRCCPPPRLHGDPPRSRWVTAGRCSDPPLGTYWITMPRSSSNSPVLSEDIEHTAA
jgi:glycolate oxidase